MAEAFDLAQKLEAVFGKVERERMQDVPILNPRLRVAVIGMRRFEANWIAVLVTPWFINVMLLPGNEEDAEAWSVPTGTKVKHHLPAGTFEFICGTEEGLGPYRMCSLFSPVLQFESQDAAVATAEACLEALFDESLNPNAAKTNAPAEAGRTTERAQLSRRNLIFGAKASQEERT